MKTLSAWVICYKWSHFGFDHHVTDLTDAIDRFNLIVMKGHSTGFGEKKEIPHCNVKSLLYRCIGSLITYSQANAILGFYDILKTWMTLHKIV